MPEESKYIWWLRTLDIDAEPENGHHTGCTIPGMMPVFILLLSFSSKLLSVILNRSNHR